MFLSFYLNRIFYYCCLLAAALFVVSYFLSPVFTIAVVIILFVVIAVLIDTLLLYSKKGGIDAYRILQDRFSNGDENKVILELENEYGFKILAVIIDELPFQFNDRKWQRQLEMAADTKTNIEYLLKPQQRGEYQFGNINVFVSSPLRIVCRRYSFEQAQTIKVYPSFFQMRRYQLLATANRLQEAGVKRMRKLGHSLEFEQIKEYVIGDDYRTINWQATARHGNLMTNNFTD